MNKLLEWLDERVGWKKVKEALLDRKIPRGVNWFYTLGSITAFLFLLQAATGILLATGYVPAPDHAYDSVRFLQEKAFLGSFLRGLHRWGASAMIVSVVLHLLRVFFMGAYKYPREVTWMTGVALLGVVIGFGFTGYLLPWDEKAYWATMVGTNIAGSVPYIGGLISKVLKGGDQLGAMTLTRFYAFHVLMLPAALLSLLGVHLFLVIWHGISSPPERESKDEELKP